MGSATKVQTSAETYQGEASVAVGLAFLVVKFRWDNSPLMKQNQSMPRSVFLQREQINPDIRVQNSAWDFFCLALAQNVFAEKYQIGGCNEESK